MKETIIILISSLILHFHCNAQEKIIVIDPGHDWDNTTGVLSPVRSVTEVVTNWEVANKLKNEIEMQYNPSYGLNWLVFLTREDNNPGTNTTYDDRERIANNLESASGNQGKVYFLSIHCNAFSDPSKTGTETFYCNNGFSTNNDLIIKYAQSIHDNMVEHCEWYDRSRNRHSGAEFTVEECHDYYGYHLQVLNELTMPNCLNEIGFVTNVSDEQKLLNDNWRNKFAHAYFEGFMEAFADLNITSYNVEQRPNFSVTPNLTWCKINTVIKDAKAESWAGDVRAKLMRLPIYNYQSPTSEYCQLGSPQSIVLGPSDQTIVTFQDHVPYAIDLGMALQLEYRKSGTTTWVKLPTPSHKKIVKVPINGALINGTLYNVEGDPTMGIEIWSNEYSNTKSATLPDPLNTSEYDPTSDRTNKNGYFELILPYDWEEGSVAVKNDPSYDATIVSPISDNLITFDNSPITVVPFPQTCNDGVMNQDETGIDCGGVCTPCGIGGNLNTLATASNCMCDDAYIGVGSAPSMASGENLMKITAVNPSSSTWPYASFKMTHGAFYYGRISNQFKCNDIVYSGYNYAQFTGGMFFEESGFLFSPDKSYEIKFNYWSYENPTIHFELANNLTDNTTPGQSQAGIITSTTTNPPSISDSYYIGHLSSVYYPLSYCDWREDDEEFRYYELSLHFNPDDNYSQLWIYTNTNEYIDFNSLKINELCTSDFVYNSNSTTVYNPTRASNSILIKDFNFEPTEETEFIAEEYILLSKNISIDPEAGGSASFLIDNTVCQDQALLSKSGEINEFSTEDEILIKNNKIELYPNPTNGNISVKNNEDEIYNINVFNSSGRNIKSINECRGNISFSLSEFPDGLYLVKIKSNTSQLIEKVIKKQ